MWLFRDHRFSDHVTGKHPECPQRLEVIDAALEREKLIERCTAGVTRFATVDELAWLHEREYIRELAAYAEKGGGRIEADTEVSPKSYDVARLAAGTAIAAVDKVMTGNDPRAFVVPRPPGHHALAGSAMGFCLFNNVALAAEAAIRQHRLERVLIIDWDVHHGNGTQDLFYTRGDVHFCSVHRSPFYPGTGSEEETGTGAGLGTKHNLPLKFGVKRKDYLVQVQSWLTHVARKCRPQLILISAGFDAHAADPVGSLGLETEDFATLTEFVRGLANEYSEGKLVSVLEGGYSLTKLGECVAAHIKCLLD